jgi:molybdopterin-guanine dinucleotide biosynthesis protein A
LKKNKKSKHIFVQKQNFMFKDSKNSFYTAVQKVNKKLFFFENSDENFIRKDLIVKSLKNFKNYLLLLQKEKKERITKTFLVFIKEAVLNKTYNTQQYINILKQLLENQKFKKFNFKKLFLNVLKLN